MCERENWSVSGFLTNIKKGMVNEYEWTGNVRELQHVLERACIMAGSGSLRLEHFDFFLSRIYKSYYILSNDNSYYYSSKYCWPNRRPSIFNDKKIL